MKQNCLDHDDLCRAVSGQMPKSQFDLAISHLDHCDTCRSAAEELKTDQLGTIGMIAGGRINPDAFDPFEAESACQIALHKMMAEPVNRLSFSSPLPCDTLGPYRLLRTLGIGGMGTVYLAEHERLKRQVAIKLLPRERVDQPGWLDRFDREMTTIAALEHPNVVRATDAGHQEGWHYLVMEYLDGMDVGRIAHRIGKLPIADACEIVRQAALGLAHVHDLGLVHRDIKPSNLMLTRSGQVKLLDLGLVLAGDDPLSMDDRLTTVGHLMGTMGYMAPEQLMDSRDVDSRADLYSLGATLYRLIAGRPPHARSRGLGSHVLAITSEEPKPLGSFRADVDDRLMKLTSELLSRDKSNRPQSADEVAERLSLPSQSHSVKKVLRESLRKRETDDFAAPSLRVSVQAGAAEPPHRFSGKWLLGGAFAASLILATIVIKIQTDKGNVVVHQEPDGVTVTIEEDGESAEPESPSLFQGKSLANWMDVLEREKDARTLGEAIQAAEVLSRDRDRRLDQALVTLKTARLLGGPLSQSRNSGLPGSSGGNPSQIYMGYLEEVFPGYLPEPGMGAIENEFRNGNLKSQTAITLLLHRYLGGVQQKNAFQWIRQQEKADEGEAFLDSLYLNLQQLAVLSTADEQNSSIRNSYATETALALQMMRRKSIVGDPWLASTIRTRIDAVKEVWQVIQNMRYGEPVALNPEPSYKYPAHHLSDNELAAAVQIIAADENAKQDDWQFLISELIVNSGYSRDTAIIDDTFDLIASEAAEPLLDSITNELERMRIPVTDGSAPPSSFGGGIFVGGQTSLWIPAFVLSMSETVWSKALPYYATHVEPSMESLERLTSLRELLQKYGVESILELKAAPYATIDQAIETLKARMP